MANKEFYKYAKAYDIAFGDRDYVAECDFVEWCLNKHGKISNNNLSFLELACGPARHAIEFAKRGWKSVALDLSEHMLEYARKLSIEEGAEVDLICGDMVEFELPERVCAAASFMESVSHILTNEEFVKHLESVYASLLPGGIYIIETAHPVNFFPDDEPNEWEAEKDGMKVKLLFGEPDDEYDAVNQIWDISSSIEIREHNKIEVIRSKSKHRWYLYQEIKALYMLAGVFGEIYFYGNMAIPPVPLDNSDESESMIIVLKK